MNCQLKNSLKLSAFVLVQLAQKLRFFFVSNSFPCSLLQGPKYFLWLVFLGFHEVVNVVQFWLCLTCRQRQIHFSLWVKQFVAPRTVRFEGAFPCCSLYRACGLAVLFPTTLQKIPSLNPCCCGENYSRGRPCLHLFVLVSEVKVSQWVCSQNSFKSLIHEHQQEQVTC